MQEGEGRGRGEVIFCEVEGSGPDAVGVLGVEGELPDEERETADCYCLLGVFLGELWSGGKEWGRV